MVGENEMAGGGAGPTTSHPSHGRRGRAGAPINRGHFLRWRRGRCRDRLWSAGRACLALPRGLAMHASTRGRCFRASFGEKVGQAESASPFRQIGSIEPVPLALEHTEHVLPLPFGNASPLFVPLQLTEDHVFG